MNSTLASLALALPRSAAPYDAIQEHGAFLNVAAQRVQPLDVNPNCWRWLRRRGRLVR